MESSSASSLAELLLETHPHQAATTLEDSTRLFEDLEATRSTVNAQRTLHQQHQQHQQTLASADLPFQLRAPLGGLSQHPAQAAAALQAQAGARFAFPAGDAQSESRARTERWIFANPGSTLFTPSGTSSVEARTTLPSTSFLTLQREATMEGPTAAVGGVAPRAATGDMANVDNQRRSSPVTAQQQQQQQQASAGPDVAAMASALSHLPPEQQQMLMHLGISDATILMQQQQQRTSSGQVNCSPPGSSSNVAGAADTTALAATATPADAAASLDAAETLWQQAVNNGTDDQTLLVLAAQLGLITTDAYGQAVLTRDILHQESSSSGPLPTSADAQAAAYAAASSGVSGFGNYGQAGAPALMLSSPTNLVGGQGFSAQLPRLPQQSTSSLEALLASVQSAGALGQLLASLGLGGGDLSRAGKNLGSPGPSKQHALYKTELCRGWLESGTCRYGAKCQFAHGREELRPVPRHPKYKTEICRSFAATGICAYGARCRFIHGAVSAPHNAIFFTDTSTAAGTSHPAVANLFNLTATATTATGLTGGTTLRPSDASLLASSSALHEGLEGVRGFDEDTFRTSAGSAHNKQQQQQLLQVPSLSQAQSGPLGLRQGAVLAQQQQQQREAARMAAMTQIMAARLLGVQQQQQQLPSASAGMSAGTASRVSLDSALSTGSYPLMGRSVRGAAGMGGGVSESQRMSLESMRHAAYGGGGASGSVFSGAHGGMGGYGMMSVPGTGTATGNRMSLESCMSQTTEGFIGQMGGGHPNQMELLRSSGEIQLMGEQGFAGRHQAGGGGGMYGNAAVLGGARSAGAGQGDAATALLQHLQQQGQHQQVHANIAAAMQQQHQQGAASTLPTWQPVLGMGPASSGAIQEAGGNKSVTAVPASLYAQQQQQQQQARAAANLWWEQQQQARGAEQQQQQGVPPHVSAYRSGLYSMGPAVGAGRPGAAVGGGARQPSPRLSHPGVVTPEMSETGLDPASDQRLGAMAAAAQR